ncbi:arginase family protein [Microbacterium awajiense]|uniref:Arginase family protein n=1 Tax=Microbacterium awajiense TaxID=415214 RepID=A0ABP7AEM8_9MICO
MTRFVIVPQWQGSPSSRAMQLIDGAHAIAGDLPRAACTWVDVPLEAGEAVDTGIHRYSALQRTRLATDEALAGHAEPVLLIGGDCGIAVAGISHARSRHPDLAVVWLDAHGDLHSPESSGSGAFGGMALRAVLDGAAEPLGIGGGGVAATRVVLAGARDCDDAELEYRDAAGVRWLDAGALAHPEALADAVREIGAAAVYVHVDLDVLDPAEITGVTGPVPFGVSAADLVAALARVRDAAPLVGASIAGFAPSSPASAIDDLGTILRIVGALA